MSSEIRWTYFFLYNLDVFHLIFLPTALRRASTPMSNRSGQNPRSLPNPRRKALTTVCGSLLAFRMPSLWWSSFFRPAFCSLLQPGKDVEFHQMFCLHQLRQSCVNVMCYIHWSLCNCWTSPIWSWCITLLRWCCNSVCWYLARDFCINVHQKDCFLFFFLIVTFSGCDIRLMLAS